ERTVAQLARYAAAWTTMRADVCAATQLMDLRMACLDRRRSELGALAQALGRDVGAATAARAVDAAIGLAPLAGCADAASLAATVPLPDDPDLRRSALALQGEVDRVAALYYAGKLRQARLSWGLVTAAAIHPWAPPRARALKIDLWLVVEEPARLAAAAPLVEALLRAAVAARDDEQIATAWMEILESDLDRGRYQDALAHGLPADLAVT